MSDSILHRHDFCGRSAMSSFGPTIVRVREIKQLRAWLLLMCVTAKLSCTCKLPVCPPIGGSLKVSFKPLVPDLS
ncbi:hypothetical protein J6590_076616 [Homalodisca vitripennis]|nr:hypothetical protein J6590_076616 [Homalodisca vitripennis]